MNVLLTSVGRRAYMVKYFKEVLGDQGEVHVSNSDDLTVAFRYADKCAITPLIYSDEYIPFLVDYCKTNKIDVLLSMFDIDLLILAQNKERFTAIGTHVIVSKPELVEICNDKWKTYLYLKENGFNVPKTYLTIDNVVQALKNGNITYPIVIKPRFGCGSIAFSIVNDETELRFFQNRNSREIQKSYLKYESASVEDKLIFQECLSGQEYGADIINDLSGNFRNAIVKRKIAMRSGETDIAETVNNKAIYDEVSRLGKLTKHIANMDCDVFLVNNTPYILEMNARFGGGYPFSHMAGCNLPKAIVSWIDGDEVPDECLQAKPGFLGFKELVITEKKH